MTSNRDVNLAIVGEDHTRKATDSAARNFDKLQREVDGFSAKKPSKQVEEFGRLMTSNLKDGETAFQSVQREIGVTEAKVASLRKEFASTGSSGVFGDLKGAEHDLETLKGLLGDMTGDVEKASKEVDDFGRLMTSNLKDGESAFQAIQRQIDATKAKIAGLRIVFARTGSQSILGDLKGTQKDLKTLESLAGDMGMVGKKAGETFASGLSSSLSETVTPQGAAIAAGLIAVASPIIVGALGVAITTGVGLGLVGIGAVVQSKNPLVKNAFETLKDDAVSVFADATEPIQGPLIDALGYVDQLVKNEPQFQALFAAAAPALTPLVHGLAGLVEDILPEAKLLAANFVAALHDPGVDREFQILGGSIVEMFSIFANNRQLVIDFFQAFLVAAGGAVVLVDSLVESVSLLDKGFHILTGAVDIATGGIFHLSGSADTAVQGVGGLITVVDDSGTAAATAAPDYDKLASQLSATTNSSDSLAASMTDRLLNSLLNNDEATLHFAESITNVSKVLKDNKDNLDIHKAAGQADREAILGVVQANIQQYDSMIAAGDSAEDAAKKYDSNFQSLEHLPGLTKTQQAAVDGLVGSYRNVPDKVNTNVAIEGLTKAINDLADLERQINHLPTSKEVTVSIAAHVNADMLDHAISTIKHAESKAFASGASWSPAMPDPSGGGGMQLPPIALTSQHTSTLTLNGRIIARDVHRAQSSQRHAAKVGRR